MSLRSESCNEVWSIVVGTGQVKYEKSEVKSLSGPEGKRGIGVAYLGPGQKAT